MTRSGVMRVADLAERKRRGGRHVPVAVDRTIQVASAIPDLEVGLLSEPGAASGSALATTALPEFGGQDQG